MTRFSDNLLSGFQAVTSALSSKSQVILRRTAFVSAGANVNVVIAGTLPPLAQDLYGAVYTVQNAATAHDTITMYINGSASNGTQVMQWTNQGSAANARNAPTTLVASACAFPQAPATNASNGGEIPYKILVSSVSTASYQIIIDFDRGNSTALGTTT